MPIIFKAETKDKNVLIKKKSEKICPNDVTYLMIKKRYLLHTNLLIGYLLVGWIQQSAAESKIPPQLSVPHTRLPAHSPSLSQSPPPNSQGCEAVQHDHVSDVQSQANVLEMVVEIKDGSEIKRKKTYQLITYHWCT